MIPFGMFPGKAVRDPYFSNVQLLLHGDGTDGSTSIVDSSSSGRVPASRSNVTVTTAQSKFSGASLAFTGSGSWINYTGFPVLGTSDFTFEAWIRPTANQTSTGLFENRRQSDYSGVLFGFGGTASPSGMGYLRLVGNKNAYNTDSTGSPVINTWSHVALTRSGDTHRIFLNGVQVLTAVINHSLPYNALAIGAHVESLSAGTGTKFVGQMDDIRVTLGVARYTANFTPPTDAFPNS